MRRLDLVLVALTLVLGTVWFFLRRQAPAPEPAGLRYAAARGDDGFEVPLSSVERMDADYLKKQLTVKLRGGRTYNFAEAGGKADALVGFQQSVARAQSRLAAGTLK